MPRPRKYADTVVKSFSVERSVYEALRTVLAGQGKSVSEEVNEFLKRRLAELKGIEQLNAGRRYIAYKLSFQVSPFHFMN